MRTRFFLTDQLLKIASATAGSGPSAGDLIASEFEGFALDFLSDTYAVRRVQSAEDLLIFDGAGMALEFNTNTYAVRS